MPGNDGVDADMPQTNSDMTARRCGAIKPSEDPCQTYAGLQHAGAGELVASQIEALHGSIAGPCGADSVTRCWRRSSHYVKGAPGCIRACRPDHYTAQRPPPVHLCPRRGRI